MEARVQHVQDSLEQPPPFLGAWRNVYIVILVYLAILIGVLYLFTQAFTY